MTRQEYLDWCKKRAMEYVQSGELTQAVTSMLSDLDKHPETEGHLGGKLGVMLLVGGHLSDERRVTEWIQGFR